MPDQLNYFLFLDDIRDPHHAFVYTKQEMFVTNPWIVVRSFDEFKNHIESFGMPHFISFDHDLGELDHTENWKVEQSGYDCALWLIEYCMDTNCDLPGYYCHSMNPIGKDKINGLLESFQRSR